MRSRAALAGAIVLALVAAPAAADWKKDYDRGLKAIEDGQWAEAESAFKAALADDPEPNARKRFQGVVMKPYLPHYYAGLAAYRQNDCADALQFWEHGPTRTIVATQPALESVRSKGVADCTQKIAAAGKPAVPVASTTTPATTPATTAAAPPKPTAAPVTPPKATPAPTPPPATVATAPKPEPPSAAPAPAALVSMVEAYLAGRYAAVAQLDPATLADGRAKAQGFLLRAASRYTLAQLAGDDAATLEQARRDVRSARSANAALNPDETAFSPRFRAFWRETR
jgi:tetratricopeptide (TPR) repeat protein